MSKIDVQVNFRMPAELKARLEQAAKGNHRSVTAELVARLEESFIPRTMDDIGQDRLKSLNARYSELSEEINRINFEIDEVYEEAQKTTPKSKEREEVRARYKELSAKMNNLKLEMQKTMFLLASAECWGNLQK